MQATQSRKLYLFFVTLIILLGIFFRIGDQSYKSFWVDEVWRAQQILHADSYLELRRGHYYGMEAPVQLSEYLAGKVGLSIFGPTEIAYRIWPVIYACLSVLIFFFIASKELSAVATILTLSMFCFSPGLVEHAHEFKPYSLEVLLSLFSLLIVVFSEKMGKLYAPALVCTLLVMLFFSNVGPFFLFLPVCLSQKDFAARLTKLPVWVYFGVAVVAAVFILFYSNYVEGLRESNTIRFWKSYYLTSNESFINFLSVEVPNRWSWYIFPFGNLATYGIRAGIPLFILMCFILPLVLFLKRGPLFLFYLIPFCLQLVLSYMGLYPFMTRVSTFFYPFVILAIGVFVDTVFRLKKDKFLFASALALILLLTPYFGISKVADGKSRHKEETAPLIRELKDKASFLDLLVTNYSASQALSFYAPDLQGASFEKRDINFKASMSEAEINRHLSQLINKQAGNRVCILQGRKAELFDQLNAALKKQKAFEITYSKHNPGAYLICFKVLNDTIENQP